MKSVLKEADKIINAHHYAICGQCPKKRCKTYCLPAEMLVLLVEESSNGMKLRMIENISRLFKDDG